MKPLRFVSYGRVSTDDQAEHGTGLETQLLDNHRTVERLGGIVVATEKDDGISGTIPPGPGRPAIERALRMLETGQADALIAYNASRLGRKTSIALAVWERIQEARAQLFLCDMGEVTEANEILFTLQGGFAQHEWRAIRKRTMEGRRRAAERGIMPNRARAPFGYRIVQTGQIGPNGEPPGSYVLVEEQARYAQEIFTRYAAGDSVRVICRWLQESGVPTPKRERATQEEPYWLPTSVTRILRNTIYKGYAAFGKTQEQMQQGRSVTVPAPPERHILIPAPALIDEDLWERCQQKLQENRDKSGCRNDRKHLFVGLLFCPKCRLRMVSRAYTSDYLKKGRIPVVTSAYYSCRFNHKGTNAKGHVCWNKSYREEKIQAAFAEVLKALRHHPQFVEAAYTEHQQRKESAYAPAEYQAVQDAMCELEKRESATAEAYARAIQLGTRKEVFEKLLTDIAAERRRLEARKSMLETAREEAQIEDGADVAAVAASYASGLLEVLKSETLTPADKNALFSRIVKEITPLEDGYRVVFEPFTVDKSLIPVAFVFTSATLRAS